MSNERKCEGCGCPNSRYGYQGINLMNGHLYLCKQCLAELNGKNPRVKELEAERDELRRVAGELYAAMTAREAVELHFQTCHQCGADLSGNVWHCAEHNNLSRQAVDMRVAALTAAATLLANEETP